PLPVSRTLLPYTTLFRSPRRRRSRRSWRQTRGRGRAGERSGVARIAVSMADPRETDPADRSTPPERDLARRSEGAPMLLVVIGRSEEHTSELQSRENLVC